MAEPLTWRKSSFCRENVDACVEVARNLERVMVRDSVFPQGTVLAFSPGCWSTFMRRMVLHQPDDRPG